MYPTPTFSVPFAYWLCINRAPKVDLGRGRLSLVLFLLSFKAVRCLLAI